MTWSRWIAITVLGCMLAGGAVARGEAKEGAFELRGFKGLWWEGLDKYRQAVPWAAEHHLNFVMLCYSSFAASGKDWRSNYTTEEMAGFKELAAEAEKRGVELCLSFNPGIWSKPPLMYGDERDYQKAWGKVKAVHAVGIHSFAICLDDINTALQPADKERFGTLAKCQVYFVNRLWGDLHAMDPKARLIFCPSAYTTAEAEKHLDYIKAVAAIDQGVQMFWTGPVVCSPTITRSDAEKYGAWIGRKPIVWDNYPVNDMFPWRPLLAPVRGRGEDLAAATSGFMANPMKQWEISKIPLATMAEYVNDPMGYYWKRAGADAIAEWPAAVQPVVRELVEVYGDSFLGEKGYPPKPGPGKDKAETTATLAKLVRLWSDLSDNPQAAGLFADVKPTLQGDIQKLEAAMKTGSTTAK